MIGTAQLRIGFPTAVDGRIDKLVENLAAIRPTFVCAVPRIFEKVHAKVLANAREGGAGEGEDLPLGARRRAARPRASSAPGRARGRSSPRSAPSPIASSSRRCARSSAGGSQFFVSGSAPLSKDIAEFFDAPRGPDPARATG